jgi:GH15 family glucan-1,4-alpha-glucosidase
MTQALTSNSVIPTESFFIANTRIMAVISGGQLTVDNVFGLSHFFAPAKDSQSLIQSTRVMLIADGRVAEPVDSETRSCLGKREYINDSLAIRLAWQAEELEVEEVYFIPPDHDVVIQRVRVRNTAARRRDLRLIGILYPQFGSIHSNQKAVCREARFDQAAGCILAEDQLGNTLVYGFSVRPDSFQVGVVCSPTDVYFDLEDQRLSGNEKVSGAVPIAAQGVDWSMKHGEERTIDIILGRADSMDAGAALHRTVLAGLGNAWQAHLSAWKNMLGKAPKQTVSGEFGPELGALVDRSTIVLRSILRPDGAPMGGITIYHDTRQTRNGCYILSALDEMGFHDEVRNGYVYYSSFKVGDNRYASADENDQLGTVIHVFKRHLDLSGDIALIREHRASLFAFADKLVALADPATGLVYSERAIHEFVAISRGYETYVNVMAWRGLKDAAGLATALNSPNEAARYEKAADALRQNVLARMIDPTLGIFVKRLYQGKPVTMPAISMLTPALFGLIDPKDEVVTRTIAFLLENIWDRKMGGLYRYPLDRQPWVEQPFSGPWVTYTSWLGRVYLLRGEREKAAECIRWVLNNVPRDSNLIPEHFSVNHLGRRGFHRVYIEPCVPEIWATAEFMRLIMAYHNGTK